MKSPELDPIQAAAQGPLPDWVQVERLVAAQPGYENYPVGRVSDVLNHSGELVARATVPGTIDTARLCIVRPNLIEPFRIDGGVAVLPEDWKGECRQRNLLVNAASGPDDALRWGRNSVAAISLSFDTPGSNDFCVSSNPRGVEPWLGTSRPPLVVGNVAVNDMFEELSERQLPNNSPQVFAGLFYAALLAMDSEQVAQPKPALRAPKSLQPELEKTITYYEQCEASVGVLKAHLGLLRSRLALQFALSGGLRNTVTIDHANQPRVFYSPTPPLPARFNVRVELDPSEAELDAFQHEAAKALQALKSLTLQ